MKPHFRAFAALCCVTLAAWAATPIAVPFKEYKLKNGLRVILSEDHSAPTYSISITYNAGSRDEREGRTGFAHLFEHMMFQGSENVGKGEHFILIQNNGGNMNGTTNEDRTNYFETLPANQLDLGLYLESDRMRSLAITQPNLDNQRKAVQEEKRLSYDNRPYGRTSEAISTTTYDNFAYKHTTIGSMEDLNAANLDDVRKFFKTYYAPNNAVLALVGDFKSDDALAKIRKYFEAIPAQPAPPSPDMSEPEQKAERRKTIEDAFAQIPRIDIAWKIPPADNQDFWALDVLSDILGGGESSRLYQKLVKENQDAVATFAGTQPHRGPSLERVVALVRPGKEPADVEKAISAEIEKIKNQSVDDWELEKIRMQDRHQQSQELQRTLSRAIELSEYAVEYNDPGLLNTRLEKVNKVTKEDIQRVAKKYLTDANKTVVITMPTAKKAPAAGGAE